jgi:hypothetical protein
MSVTQHVNPLQVGSKDGVQSSEQFDHVNHAPVSLVQYQVSYGPFKLRSPWLWPRKSQSGTAVVFIDVLNSHFVLDNIEDESLGTQ